MTFIFYLLFFLTLITFSVSKSKEVHQFVNSVSDFHANGSVAPFKLIFNNNFNLSKLNSIAVNAIGNFKNENLILEKSEVKKLLKTYNQKLNRNLKTLAYISIMEIKPEVVSDTKQYDNIINLKSSVQREVIKITERINYYNSLI